MNCFFAFPPHPTACRHIPPPCVWVGAAGVERRRRGAWAQENFWVSSATGFSGFLCHRIFWCPSPKDFLNNLAAYFLQLVRGTGGSRVILVSCFLFSLVVSRCTRGCTAPCTVAILHVRCQAHDRGGGGGDSLGIHDGRKKASGGGPSGLVGWVPKAFGYNRSRSRGMSGKSSASRDR